MIPLPYKFFWKSLTRHFSCEPRKGASKCNRRDASSQPEDRCQRRVRWGAGPVGSYAAGHHEGAPALWRSSHLWVVGRSDTWWNWSWDMRQLGVWHVVSYIWAGIHLKLGSHLDSCQLGWNPSTQDVIINWFDDIRECQREWTTGINLASSFLIPVHIRLLLLIALALKKTIPFGLFIQGYETCLTRRLWLTPVYDVMCKYWTSFFFWKTKSFIFEFFKSMTALVAQEVCSKSKPMPMSSMRFGDTVPSRINARKEWYSNIRKNKEKKAAIQGRQCWSGYDKNDSTLFLQMANPPPIIILPVVFFFPPEVPTQDPKTGDSFGGWVQEHLKIFEVQISVVGKELGKKKAHRPSSPHFRTLLPRTVLLFVGSRKFGPQVYNKIDKKGTVHPAVACPLQQLTATRAKCLADGGYYLVGRSRILSGVYLFGGGFIWRFLHLLRP